MPVRKKKILRPAWEEGNLMKLSLSNNKEPVIKRRTSVPLCEPIERRSVTSRFGSKISGSQRRRRTAKKQLCTRITLLCTFLSRCLHDCYMKLPNFTRPVYFPASRGLSRRGKNERKERDSPFSHFCLVVRDLC